MANIKSSSIRYLLNNVHRSEVRQELAQLIKFGNENKFSPVWLGLMIAMRISDLAAVKDQLKRMGFTIDAIDESLDPNDQLLHALTIFFDPQQQAACNFNQGLRISDQRICRYMAEVDVAFSLAGSGNAKLLKQAIHSGWINPRILKNEYNENLLHQLAANGHWQLVLQLHSDYSLDLNVKNENGATPLHCLMSYADLDLIKTIMQQQGLAFNLNQGQDEQGRTYGHYFVSGCDFIALETALAQGLIDPFLQDAAGNTLWHYVALSGNLNYFAQVLAKYNAQYKTHYQCDLIEIKNKAGQTVLDFFALNGNTKDLYAAAQLCGRDLSVLIKQAAAANTKTILHFVCDPENLKEEEKKLFQTVRDEQGYTPCHNVVRDWLGGLGIDHLNDTEEKNNNGLTPLEQWTADIDDYKRSLASYFFLKYDQVIRNYNENREFKLVALTEEERLKICKTEPEALLFFVVNFNCFYKKNRQRLLNQLSLEELKLLQNSIPIKLNFYLKNYTQGHRPSHLHLIDLAVDVKNQIRRSCSRVSKTLSAMFYPELPVDEEEPKSGHDIIPDWKL